MFLQRPGDLFDSRSQPLLSVSHTYLKFASHGPPPRPSVPEDGGVRRVMPVYYFITARLSRFDMQRIVSATSLLPFLRLTGPFAISDSPFRVL